MEQSSYESFVQQKVFTYAAITEYARTQNVPPFVVVSRLQKEGIIPDSKYNRYGSGLNLPGQVLSDQSKYASAAK